MLNKKTIRDISVKNKRVLVRCDFNVPLDKETKSVITSDKRIIESLKTIKYLIDAGAKIILCSHIGKYGKGLSLKPVSVRLSELLEQEVKFVPDCLSKELPEIVKSMKKSDVILLENVRMYEQEEQNDDEFSKKLASVAQIFVNDAFGTSHRKHSSTVGVTKYLPSVCGFLIEKEINAITKSLDTPVRPLVSICGGSKVSSKIGVLEGLIDKSDTILVGGAMAFTFLKALGYNVGKSLYEETKLDIALEILNKAKEKNVEFLLPVDTVVTNEISNVSHYETVNVNDIQDEMIGVDIGENTRSKYSKIISGAGTVLLNGPVGIIEIPNFSKGTEALVIALAESHAVTVVGGGDSALAVEKFNMQDKMSHISTGGGATLKLIEGSTLVAVEALEDKVIDEEEI